MLGIGFASTSAPVYFKVHFFTKMDNTWCSSVLCFSFFRCNFPFHSVPSVGDHQVGVHQVFKRSLTKFVHFWESVILGSVMFAPRKGNVHLTALICGLTCLRSEYFGCETMVVKSSSPDLSIRGFWAKKFRVKIWSSTTRRVAIRGRGFDSRSPYRGDAFRKPLRH